MGIDFVELALGELEKWDSQLVELVKESKINPWDIDITILTSRYLERINAMRKLDFRVPAKAVITAAVLLKLKSEKLFAEEKARKEREVTEDVLPMDLLDVPDLFPVRRVVERKITIVELVDALRSAFEVEKRKLMRKKRLGQIVKIDTTNIARVMQEMRVILDDLFYARETIELSDLVKYKEFSLLFITLLYLAHRGEIDLEQEEWNGPVKIRRAIAIAAVGGAELGGENVGISS
jgi:segregation and condensation protein A